MGVEVVCTGRITTYPGSSRYQIIVEQMELAGAGALMAMLAERKKRLAAEGLFDAARKKPLPFLPDVIGVITSPTGAVIRDIMHRLNARFPPPGAVVAGWRCRARSAAGEDRRRHCRFQCARLAISPKARSADRGAGRRFDGRSDGIQR